MSRENSSDAIPTLSLTVDPYALSSSLATLPTRSPTSPMAGPSKLPFAHGRKASKSVSNSRPPISSSTKRTMSYHPSAAASPGPVPGSGPGSVSAQLASPKNEKRGGLKRRISTPSLAAGLVVDGEEDQVQPEVADKSKAVESRARSTSTSVVVPQTLQTPESPIIAVQTMPLRPISAKPAPLMLAPWSATPPALPEPDQPSSLPSQSRGTSLLTSAYNAGESSIRRLASLVRPDPRHKPRRRGSEDSEKGLDDTTSLESVTSQSFDGSPKPIPGKYWGIWKSEEEGSDGYFSLPPTPPEEKAESSPAEFEVALQSAGRSTASLPTPALSTHSLSTGRRRRFTRREAGDGWLRTLLFSWVGRGSGKTGEVIRELGWTVGLLVGLFFLTLGVVFWMIKSMPITQLKHVPSSTTDLQLLSAEIRAYMASGDSGWWHTVGVLTFVGCWKHAWSVPGAVVLNILVGSVLDPMPALMLLTLITASGSLGSYLLSRPLAPLIAVLFPKPLALVRAALAPDSIPAPSSTRPVPGETVTPIQVLSDPAIPPIGGEPKPVVWRRLLIMRAMGFVPWSGMNVACGVVGVDWKVFWLTTAAGSASWSYVTASVGNILSRLALPTAALAASSVPETTQPGESLTSLLRDPVLIAKLVFLTALTLIPVMVKSKSPASSGALSPPDTPRESYEMSSSEEEVSHEKPILPAISTLRAAGGAVATSPPMSPLTQSLARFTPTPRVFDLLSFGRTAVRHGASIAMSGAGAAVGAVERVTGVHLGSSGDNVN